MPVSNRVVCLFGCLVTCLAVGLAGACVFKEREAGDGGIIDRPARPDALIGTIERERPPCTGLACNQTDCVGPNCMQQPCPGGGRTTASGTVYDPAGKVPLYNVLVYVPNGAVDPITDGANSCDVCAGPPANAIAATFTDVQGKFVLDNVPVGSNVPVVMQVGKWRREMTISSVAACTNTDIVDVNATRMPRNKSEGNIPKIALTTGGRDALECLLRKIGIEDSEFTTDTGNGRVNLFAGGIASNDTEGSLAFDAALNGGAPLTPANPWWNSADNLKKYDVIILSCEGNENLETKSMAAREALRAYLDGGGKVFASHWHRGWFRAGPQPLPTVAMFRQTGAELPAGFIGTIDTNFKDGRALADWMMHVGGSTMYGQFAITEGKHTINGVTTVSRRWVYGRNGNQNAVQYLDFTAPVGGAVCGRGVISDIHVSAGDTSNEMTPFPTGCVTTEMTPQEKALEFMIFNLTACVPPYVE